jgi:hypothetical protein
MPSNIEEFQILEKLETIFHSSGQMKVLYGLSNRTYVTVKPIVREFLSNLESGLMTQVGPFCGAGASLVF